MSNQNVQVEYVVRVKIPIVPHEVIAAQPIWQEDICRYIMKQKPEGFEVAWETVNEWPVDKDGFTWVKLYCTDQRKGVEYFHDLLQSARKELDRVKALAQQICR